MITRTPTARQLNRATLDRQLLLERHSIGVVDAVRRIVAIQAQEPASPYVALWNRLDPFDPAELDRAFAERTVVKAPLMRITLHAVAADEYPMFHQAASPTLRAARLNDRRFKVTGLGTDDADALVAGLTAFGSEPRSKEQILAHLAEQLGEEPHDGVWWALRTYAPMIHSPMEPPWSFGRRPWFETPRPGADRPSTAEALLRVIVRYLEGFGPASVADFAQFTMQKRSVVRAAFDELGEQLVTVEGHDEVQLYDVASAAGLPDPDRPAPPRLMAMWDSILLAYADRSRVIPEEHRSDVIRRNGDVLPTVLVDGWVAGVWRPVDGGIEVTVFRRLDDDTWAALETEAAAFRRFVAERDPDVYGRYGRWWDRLPVVERRIVGSVG